ncbi:molecular chaperone DnaK, partial [Acinetobacter baumannii]
VDALKTALQGEDDAAVKTAFDKLNESQTKLGEAIYQSAQAQSAESSEQAAPESSSDEDVVDAEIVEDEEPKK